MKIQSLIRVVVVAHIFFVSVAFGGVDLLFNGGFETGSLSGWNVNDAGSGSWFAVTGTTLPESNRNTVGASSGNFYAASDQTGPGTHAISQTFTVPGPGTVIVSFDMFVNDADGGPIIDPIGLDHTGPPNQHARVDIMAEGSPAFDTGSGVISALYIGVDSQLTKPNPYTSYVFDITDAVVPGESYDIRFAETDNQLFLNMGIDNVQIDFTAVPEPTTGLMSMLAVLFGFAMAGRRRP